MLQLPGVPCILARVAIVLTGDAKIVVHVGRSTDAELGGRKRTDLAA